MEAFNVSLPQSWHDMSQQQLRQTFAAIATGYTAPQVRMRLALLWADIAIIGQEAEGCAKRAQSEACFNSAERQQARRSQDTWLVQHRRNTFLLHSWQLDGLAARLAFLDTPPQNRPAILLKVGSHPAIDPLLQGTPFETYIVLENLFQGYLQTKDNALLHQMGHHLYPGSTAYTPAETTCIFYWFITLKGFFSRKYHHFFAPADGAAGASVEEAMNAQIRALTQGDVTKEAAVLATETWRALTELDAIARETQELKRTSHEHL